MVVEWYVHIFQFVVSIVVSYTGKTFSSLTGYTEKSKC